MVSATRTKANKRSFAGLVGKLGGVPAAPANTVAPSISGTAQVGQTLTAANGTWTGRPTPALTRQWRAGGAVISGATGATYVPVEADEGKTITVTVSGSNTYGSASATSSATAAVAAAAA